VAGPAGSSIFLSSAGDAVLTTILGGLAGNLAVLPLSGAVLTAVPTMPAAPDVSLFPSLAQPLPAVTLTNINAHLTNKIALALIGTTLTAEARVYRIAFGTNVATATTLFCTFTPLTGIVPINDTSTCASTGSASFAAGDRAFIGVSTTAAGLALINVLTAAVTVGVGQ
jgi:hypothetical protein